MSERVTPEELRDHATPPYKVQCRKCRLLIYGAADTIKALTAERDEAVALLREWRGNLDLGSVDARTRAFLARLDGEGEG